MGRLAVQTGLWVLYEIENGSFKLNSPSDRLIDKSRRKSVKDYFSLQGRFRNMTEKDVELVQRWVDEDWEHHQKRLEQCV
jgi:pyruvate ferredoxin oxidoreductase beta subunit